MLNNPHVHHNLKNKVLELHERSTDLNRELSCSDLQQHTYVSVTSLMQSKARSLTGDADNHVPTSASVLFQGAPIFSVSVPGMYPNNQLIQKNLKFFRSQ
jgi:hypothetical protein